MQNSNAGTNALAALCMLCYNRLQQQLYQRKPKTSAMYNWALAAVKVGQV